MHCCECICMYRVPIGVSVVGIVLIYTGLGLLSYPNGISPAPFGIGGFILFFASMFCAIKKAIHGLRHVVEPVVEDQVDGVGENHVVAMEIQIESVEDIQTKFAENCNKKELSDVDMGINLPSYAHVVHTI